MPALPGLPAAPAPVVPDTATVAFAPPDSAAAPVLVTAVPDTVPFGGEILLVWDYASGAEVAPSTPLPQADGDWLAPVEDHRPWWRRLPGVGAAAPAGVADLPPAVGPRRIAAYRVYRADPFRIAYRGAVGPVITVGTTGATPGTLADIRDPRWLGLLTWQLALWLLLLALLALGAWLLWRRRRPRVPLDDWVPPAPAWPRAARDLAALLDARHLERGDGAAFLDGLASIVRSYAAVRYGVAAREMTGPELVAACRRAGYAAGHPTGFGRLLGEADRRRYDPVPPDVHWCREQAVQFFGRLARVRCADTARDMAPDDERAAQLAWRRLTDELGLGAGRETVAAGPTAGGD